MFEKIRKKPKLNAGAVKNRDTRRNRNQQRAMKRNYA